MRRPGRRRNGGGFRGIGIASAFGRQVLHRRFDNRRIACISTGIHPVHDIDVRINDGETGEALYVGGDFVDTEAGDEWLARERYQAEFERCVLPATMRADERQSLTLRLRNASEAAWP